MRSGIGLSGAGLLGAGDPADPGYALPRYAAGGRPGGTGSDVLGLDDAMSSDHDWGLRLQVFVPRGEESAGPGGAERVCAPTVCGTSSRFPQQTGAAEAENHRRADRERLRHGSPGLRPPSSGDAAGLALLTGPSRPRRTAGAVFDDAGSGELTALRAALERYRRCLALCRRLTGAGSTQNFAVDGALLTDRGDEPGSRSSPLASSRHRDDLRVHAEPALASRMQKWRGTMFGRLGLPGRCWLPPRWRSPGR